MTYVQMQTAPTSDNTQSRHLEGMRRLVRAVRDLSLARSLDDIVEIVRHAARELNGADGSSFVLLDGDNCYYIDEDAIEPTWKGMRFPSNICIGGWAMRNRQSVVIEDVYTDSRIPIEAYRPTFIKSLVMVPVRTERPIAAIGNYWAQPHSPTPQEVELIQALADSTSVAFENVRVYEELEQRVRDRTAQLQAAIQELEAFSYSASHDLRSPLANIMALSEMLLEEDEDADPRRDLGLIHTCCQTMDRLIQDMLRLSKVARADLVRQQVDVSGMVSDILDDLQRQEPTRRVELAIAPGMQTSAAPNLLRIALTNLLGNAWKYTCKNPRARIEVSVVEREGRPYFAVRDNGAGFDMKHADKLFQPFQRLHSDQEFQGSGIGLATVTRVIQRHGGSILAEAAPDKGAVFYFSLEP